MATTSWSSNHVHCDGVVCRGGIGEDDDGIAHQQPQKPPAGPATNSRDGNRLVRHDGVGTTFGEKAVMTYQSVATSAVGRWTNLWLLWWSFHESDFPGNVCKPSMCVFRPSHVLFKVLASATSLPSRVQRQMKKKWSQATDYGQCFALSSVRLGDWEDVWPANNL